MATTAPLTAGPITLPTAIESPRSAFASWSSSAPTVSGVRAVEAGMKNALAAPRTACRTTSSHSRASIPGPIPRSSRTRQVRTSSATGRAAGRIVSAARRYARTVYGFASASSSSAANESSRAAMWAMSIAVLRPAGYSAIPAALCAA